MIIIIEVSINEIIQINLSELSFPRRIISAGFNLIVSFNQTVSVFGYCLIISFFELGMNLASIAVSFLLPSLNLMPIKLSASISFICSVSNNKGVVTSSFLKTTSDPQHPDKIRILQIQDKSH